MNATSAVLDKTQCTILLVEDEATVRTVTREVLESGGYQVIEANGPEQATEIFGQFEGRIQVLLTDVVMPSINGMELARRLTKKNPALITIFMSGYADNIALLHTSRDFPSWYIQKPFTVGLLLARVAEALSLPIAATTLTPRHGLRF